GVTALAGVGARPLAATRLGAGGPGSFVVLSPAAGGRARRSNFVYGSTKAGLDAFFQGLGDALAGSGASVMIVRPGFVHTKMTAGGDPGPPATAPGGGGGAGVRGPARGGESAGGAAAPRWGGGAGGHVPRPLFRKLPV